MELRDSFAIVELHNQVFSAPAVCRTDYHRIFIVRGGHGSLQIDESVFPLSGSELFLLAKGQVYSFHSGSGITGYELCFGDCFWERAPASAGNCKAVLFNDAQANQQLPLGEADRTELDFLFRTLHAEFNKEDYVNKSDALAAYLKIIMIKIANVNASLTKGFDNYEKGVYHRFVELVSASYRTTHEVADFALQLNISARRLSDLCKYCSGRGAKEIINGQLVAEAKRALQFSSRSVKEIAFELNFSTPEQFSHFFKKHASLSPAGYRESFVNIGR